MGLTKGTLIKKRRTNIMTLFLALFLGLNIASIAWLDGWGTLFYRVTQEYGMVLTSLDGNRSVETNAGLHFRICSLNPLKWFYSAQKHSMRLEYIFLDNDPNPHEMQTADKLKFFGAGVWTLKIVDLYKFGVQTSRGAREMLTANLNGIAKPVIQSCTVEENVTQIEKINAKINSCKEIPFIENQYGVKIVSFRMMHATYTKELNEKTAQAKGIKIVGEATKEAAKDFAQATRTRFGALRDALKDLIAGSGVTTEEGKLKALETLQDLALYETLEKRPAGETVYVIPRGSVPAMVLPAPAKTEHKSGVSKSELSQSIEIKQGSDTKDKENQEIREHMEKYQSTGGM